MYAVKVIQNNIFTSALKKERIQKEIEILQNTNSEYVVDCIGTNKSQNNTYIFLQFCNGGDLSQCLKSRVYMPEGEAHVIYRQIMKGMEAINKEKTRFIETSN